VKFRLRAKYLIRARTSKSRVYDYHDPEVSSVARPVPLEVRKHQQADATGEKLRPFLDGLRAPAAAPLPYPR
jgi:hypothetical protein